MSGGVSTADVFHAKSIHSSFLSHSSLLVEYFHWMISLKGGSDGTSWYHPGDGTKRRGTRPIFLRAWWYFRHRPASRYYMLWTPWLQEPSRLEAYRTSSWQDQTGVRDEHCVASDYEEQLYGSMQTCQHSPHDVLHHMVFLCWPQQLSACNCVSPLPVSLALLILKIAEIVLLSGAIIPCGDSGTNTPSSRKWPCTCILLSSTSCL